MSDYEIGKDIQELRHRIDVLEGNVRRVSPESGAENLCRPLSSDSADLGEEIIDPKDALPLQHDDAQIQSVSWQPPFSRDNGDWWYKKGGTLSSGGNPPKESYTTGILDSWIHNYARNVGDDDTCYHFHEAKFWFSYRNTFRGGRLRLRADFWIKRADLELWLNDETGVSSVDVELFQRFRVKAWRKSSSGEYDLIHNDRPTYKRIEKAYRPRRGRGGHWPDITREQPWNYDKTTSISVDRGQKVIFSVGIWTGINFATNDWGVNTINRLLARLDKVTAEIVDE